MLIDSSAWSLFLRRADKHRTNESVTEISKFIVETPIADLYQTLIVLEVGIELHLQLTCR